MLSEKEVGGVLEEVKEMIHSQIKKHESGNQDGMAESMFALGVSSALRWVLEISKQNPLEVLGHAENVFEKVKEIRELLEEKTGVQLPPIKSVADMENFLVSLAENLEPKDAKQAKELEGIKSDIKSLFKNKNREYNSDMPKEDIKYSDKDIETEERLRSNPLYKKLSKKFK